MNLHTWICNRIASRKLERLLRVLVLVIKLAWLLKSLIVVIEQSGLK